jgi:broad specificity phosphatase PhoE
MQIVLVRHGATDWNLEHRCQGSTDRDLSEVGVLQAEQIGSMLRHESVQAIYASNLRRARQTAQMISRHHNLPVLTETDIRELDHGALEGLTFNQIKENYGDFLMRWRSEPADLQVPGGEKLSEVAERAWQALNRIVERHPEAENIFVVSHNFPILGIVCRITGTPLNYYRTFHLEPCSLTRVRYENSHGWRVTHVNNREYSPETWVAAQRESR